jgi:hypothetical protein
VLAARSISVTHCIMWHIPYLHHFFGQHPDPADEQHPPALDALT